MPADPTDPSVPAIAVRQPDPIKRLHNRPVVEDTAGMQAVPPPAPPQQGRERVKPIKRIERWVTAIFKLGRTEWMAKQALRRGDQIAAQADDLARRLDALDLDTDTAWEVRHALAEETARYKSGLSVLSRSISDLTGRLDRLMLRDGGAGEAAPPVTGLPVSEGFETFKDQFYHRLENAWRGSRAEITRRLKVYLPEVRKAVDRSGGGPVLDLGCGRGEWLEVLREADIGAFGIDTNAVQIEEAREAGLDARLGDAVTALSEAEDASVSVITAHHLIEHLPFDTVAWITREAMRVLAPGGLLLFETPDTRNVLVGATTFHTDPTHLKPMPEQVMSVLLETAGFDPVEIRHINPHERLDEFLSKEDVNDEIAYLLFGPQDLTILGVKPLADG